MRFPAMRQACVYDKGRNEWVFEKNRRVPFLGTQQYLKQNVTCIMQERAEDK
jgi:hypothetical protein